MIVTFSGYMPILSRQLDWFSCPLWGVGGGTVLLFLDFRKANSLQGQCEDEHNTCLELLTLGSTLRWLGAICKTGAFQ